LLRIPNIPHLDVLSKRGWVAKDEVFNDLPEPHELVEMIGVDKKGFQAVLASCHAGHDGRYAWNPIYVKASQPIPGPGVGNVTPIGWHAIFA
jgi:hypothetical protein